MLKLRRRDNLPLYCALLGACAGIIFSGAMLLVENWMLSKSQNEHGMELVIAGLAYMIFFLLQAGAIEFLSPKTPSDKSHEESPP